MTKQFQRTVEDFVCGNCGAKVVGNGYTTIPDATNAFLYKMGDAIFKGTIPRIVLVAPYSKLNKVDVVKKAQIDKFPFEQSYSCYRGGVKPCGKCEACVEREIAIRK
jgi:7-cyano-7-deazaguanine synthase